MCSANVTRMSGQCKPKLQDVVSYARHFASCPSTDSVLETKIAKSNK